MNATPALLFLANYIPNGAIMVITALAVIILALTGYIIYLYLEGKKKPKEKEAVNEEPVVKETIIKETVIIKKTVVDNTKVEVKPIPVVIPVVAGGSKKMPLLYNYSFQARRHLMDEKTLALYNILKNHILSYEGVSVNQTWDHEIFMLSGRDFARLRFRGKTFKLYLGINAADYPEPKFPLIDEKKRKIDETTPTLLNIKGPRMMKYGMELIDDIMAEKEVGKVQNYKAQNFKVKAIDRDTLIEMKLIVIGGGKFVKPVAEETTIYNYSFQARRHLMDEKTLALYNTIKNHILSYEGVSVNQTWDHEIFMSSGRGLVRLRYHGKTMKVYLDIEVADYPEPKFPLIDESKRKSENTTNTLLNVKGPRMVKYALTLIDDIAASRGLVKNEAYVEENFKVKAISRDKLVNLGLIKIKEVKLGK